METQEQLEALESQLREKEQLVAALTERLEQAAEQLDRLHRTGADRGLRMAGGVPQELIDEQKELVEDLRRAVQQWEDMQAGAALGRVEIQVSELRDLIAGQVAGGSFSIDPAGYHGPAAGSGESSESDDGRLPVSSESDSPLDAYEAMKASLLGSEPESADKEITEEAPEPSSPAPAFSLGDVAEIEPVDPPEAIDVTEASTEELQQAVETRDSYIQYLIRKLRAAELRGQVPADWEALNNAPDDLRAQLEAVNQKLQEALRLAEVEQSMERARLGREEARIRQLEEQVQKEIKRAGVKMDRETSGQETDAAPHEDPEEQGASARWMRMLGMGKGKEPPD